jgi:hypothetical protein
MNQSMHITLYSSSSSSSSSILATFSQQILLALPWYQGKDIVFRFIIEY